MMKLYLFTLALSLAACEPEPGKDLDAAAGCQDAASDDRSCVAADAGPADPIVDR